MMRAGVTLLLVLWASSSFADEFSVEPGRTLIASPVRLIVKIDTKPGDRIRLPEDLSLPDGMELVSAKIGDSEPAGDGALRRAVVYELMAYRLGEVTIPGFEYVVVSSDGSETVRKAGPFEFAVESVRKDPATADQIKDIRPPVEVGLRWSAYIVPTLVLLAVLAAVFLAWRWGRSRLSKKAPPPPPPPRPAHEVAYDELKKLKIEDPYGKGRFQEHFSRVSEITRGYLESRYGVLALERTTAELEEEFGGMRAAEQVRDRLFRLLRACDLVKFARRYPTREQADEAVSAAVEIINRTKPGMEGED